MGAAGERRGGGVSGRRGSPGGLGPATAARGRCLIRRTGVRGLYRLVRKKTAIKKKGKRGGGERKKEPGGGCGGLSKKTDIVLASFFVVQGSRFFLARERHRRGGRGGRRDERRRAFRWWRYDSVALGFRVRGFPPDPRVARARPAMGVHYSSASVGGRDEISRIQRFGLVMGRERDAPIAYAAHGCGTTQLRGSRDGGKSPRLRRTRRPG